MKKLLILVLICLPLAADDDDKSKKVGNAAYFTRLTTTVFIGGQGPAVQLMKITVPPGSYLVAAKIVANTNLGPVYTGPALEAACSLSGPSGQIDQSEVAGNAYGASYYAQATGIGAGTIPLMGAVVLSTQGTLMVSCSGFFNFNASNGFLSATQVGTLVAE